MGPSATQRARNLAIAAARLPTTKAAVAKTTATNIPGKAVLAGQPNVTANKNAGAPAHSVSTGSDTGTSAGPTAIVPPTQVRPPVASTPASSQQPNPNPYAPSGAAGGPATSTGSALTASSSLSLSNLALLATILAGGLTAWFYFRKAK